VSKAPAAIPARAAAGHPLRIGTPFFASAAASQAVADAGGTLLLRYQTPEFIPRFLTQLEGGRLQDPTIAEWWRGDRFSAHDDRLVLRLPIHRTFYLVVCEVACDRLGAPALDPARLRSAGFVIRRLGARGDAPVAGRQPTLIKGMENTSTAVEAAVSASNPAARALSQSAGNGEQQWRLEEGEPLGWGALVGGDRDPDLGRRVCVNGVLRRGITRPLAYSGEETHPLHPVSARDADGRLHTLLYGFLPLGGQAMAGSSPFDAADEAEAAAADRARLPWPFGYAGPLKRVWQASDAMQVAAGTPTPAFFAFLEVLVNRYRLGQAGRGGDADADPLNADLAKAARGLGFTDPIAPREQHGASADDRMGKTGRAAKADERRPLIWDEALMIRPRARFSLLDYLQSCFDAGDANPLTAWLAEQRRLIDRAGGLASSPRIEPLPARPGDGSGQVDARLELDLLIAEADAEEWRLRLGQRLIDQVRRTGSELLIPKFRQGPADLFQVLPFVRACDDDGRERITWASASNRSVPFRVAAPLDPDASRPTLIQLPSLRDLRRGLAKGAAMLVPPDTQTLMDGLNLDAGVGPDLAEKPPANAAGLGIQWICSFSIPVVTLVAMILLMIMVYILNILFFWLPWVRICLPFPKIK